MSIISAQVEAQLRERFAGLQDPVQLTAHVRSAGASRLLLSSGTLAGGTSDQVRELVQAVAAASAGRVEAVINEVPLGEDAGDLPRVTVGRPAEEHPRVEFRGLPAGYELATLVDAVERVSTGRHLGEDAAARLRELESEVEVMVFVTPTCQYCPAAASAANRMALASEKVRSITVEANEFPDLAYRFGVQGVPLTVVNGQGSFVGALPEADFVSRVLDLARPPAGD